MRLGEGKNARGGEEREGEKKRMGRKKVQEERARREGQSEWDLRRLKVGKRSDAQKKGKRFITEDGERKK